MTPIPKDQVITFQVAFKGGIERHAIKFDYHLDRDTIEDVVQEMIDEQVLSIRFRMFVIGELKKTLQEFSRIKLSEQPSIPQPITVVQCQHCQHNTPVVETQPRRPRVITRIHELPPVNTTDLKVFPDACPVEDFVMEIARRLGRTPEKALEWLNRLKAQDLSSVGDLRALRDEDWNQLGLTVFAVRSFKDSLSAKNLEAIPTGSSITTGGGSPTLK